MATFGLGIFLFTLIVLALVTIILAARSRLVSTGDVEIRRSKTVRLPDRHTEHTPAVDRSVVPVPGRPPHGF